MDEFLSVLRGSNAIAVPGAPEATKTDAEGFYLPATKRWLDEMVENERKSREYRTGGRKGRR